MKEIKITKAERILNFIAEAGEDGRDISEIIAFMSVQNTGKSIICNEKGQALYLGQIQKLLHTFAKRVWPEGKYVIDSPIGPPFYPNSKLSRHKKKLHLIRKKNAMKRKFDAIELL